MYNIIDDENYFHKMNGLDNMDRKSRYHFLYSLQCNYNICVTIRMEQRNCTNYTFYETFLKVRQNAQTAFRVFIFVYKNDLRVT